MQQRPARTIILMPSPLAEELLRLAHDWVAAWIVDPFLAVVLDDGSVGEDPVTPDVTAIVVGRDGSVAVDLLDELGERSTDLLRVVGISISDDLLGVDGSSNRAEALRVEQMLQRAASTHNRVRAINLMIAETAATGLSQAELIVPKWDFNVLASWENRTELRAFDAFVRRSRRRDLNGFILTHALSVGGLWSGMSSGPYDDAATRVVTDGVDLQRVSVRGVLAQDFMVQMAQRGLELLVQEETPLRDPAIQLQFSGRTGGERLVPIADERVDEAVALLTAFVLDGVSGRPLRYTRLPRPAHTVARSGAWASAKSFGRFSLDKVRALPRWAAYRVRSGLQRRTGRTLHGEDGADLIVTQRHPFGDAVEFERDIAEALELRRRGLEALAQAPAITAAGPDTYAHLWAALRQGTFRMLDGGDAQRAEGLEAQLVERKLHGILPNGALICPDARDPWSPHPEVAALIEAETRDLPLTVGWLEVEAAARWSEVLEDLALTYDERVRAVESAQQFAADELAANGERMARNRSDLEAVDALLDLDEHDHGPVLSARIDAALAGVDPEVRARLVPPRLQAQVASQVQDFPAGIDAGVDDDDSASGMGSDLEHAPEDGEAVESVVEPEPPVEMPVPSPEHPAFDREAAEAWQVLLLTHEQELEARRTELVEQQEQLAAELEMLAQVHPIVTEDLLTLRAWRWRLERSFAGRLVHALEDEQRQLQADHRAVVEELEREHDVLAPSGNLYERFVRRMTIGFVVAAVLTRLLWRPILNRIGVEYGAEGALVADYLGVPAYPFLTLFVLVVLWALLDYHRSWSRGQRALAALRHDLRHLPPLVEHLQRERVRTFELHRQAREMLRIISEVIHRPFLLDGVGDSLPSSRSLDPEDLPKIARFARPEVDDTWVGETRFIQRILTRQLRVGWRSNAYERLLSVLQARHGIVRGELDPQRADQDPVVRTAVVEQLLLDDAQRDAGVARVREVLDDILGWQVEHDFPYPGVRVVRVAREEVDVRTDMFADGSEPAEEWRGFLSADVAADERWAPETFVAGHRGEGRKRRDRIVHAPPRFHGDSPGARMVAPRPDEVRPVEMVVRIDVVPEGIPTARMSAFAARPESYDRRDDREDNYRDEGDPMAAEDAVSVAYASAIDESDDGGFNF